MFEESDFLTELEIALHEREDEDLLSFMNCNINGVLSKMTNLKEKLNSEIGKGNLNIDSDKGRMYFVFSIFINLWNCRN